MTALIDDLKQLLPRVLSDSDSLNQYGRDWSRLHQPRPSAIVFPESIEQVQALVNYANSRSVALVPSGGRTGMSGGALAANDELVVSFERMNQILHFDPIEASVRCQPGVITQTLQEFARDKNLYYPVDFGSRGSSHIGGNIATNAGGIKVIRYGLTRNWISGLKVVTGKGELLDLNKNLVKNATGYDLRHLFIGSEGTLGFVVEATVRLTRSPQEPRVLLLAVNDLDSIMRIFSAFNSQLELNAFECFTSRCLHYVTAHGVTAPFASDTTPYYVLIEFDNTDETRMDTALSLFEHCSEQGWASDGVMNESEAQARDLWRLREDISESIAQYTPYKNDVSVPVAKVADFMRDCDALLRQHYPHFDVLWFGHVGDGNLHINVLKPADLSQTEFVARCHQVNALLFGLLQDFGGSISAEHGVGLTKKPYLQYSRDAAEIAYMKALKQVFDPSGIMNPGKVFD